MTAEEKIKQQSEQDNATFDYDKWSFARRQAKLSTDHDLWKQERDAVLARWQTNNDETRRKYLAGLENEKTAKQAEADARIDARLEPQKQFLKREWLANNPNETAADFEKKAWVHLRENLLEQRRNETFEAELQSQRSTGRYNL
jgi:hypothetical protein